MLTCKINVSPANAKISIWEQQNSLKNQIEFYISDRNKQYNWTFAENIMMSPLAF